MEKAVENTSKLIGGVIGLIVIGLIGALIVFNPLVSGVVGGMFATSDLRSKAEAEVNERIYKDTCVRYKEASVFDRWTSPTLWKMGWCQDYLDRM